MILVMQDEGSAGGKGEKGLALDWLELLDPGTLAGLPQLQAQLMFAKGLTSKGMKKDGERKGESPGLVNKNSLLLPTLLFCSFNFAIKKLSLLTS